jgi:hypothetical protein
VLLDEILEIDREGKGRVVVRMPTYDDLPLTREQRAHPIRHPRHVSGGLMIHMTGMVGMVHAYYVMGLRHSEGWIGYGGRIYSGKFLALAPPGEPMILTGVATQVRKLPKMVFARYLLTFTQGGKTIYEGDQSAMWVRPDEAVALLDSMRAQPPE